MQQPNAEEFRKIIATVVHGVIDAIRDAKLGMPGGVLYAILMEKGMTLAQFERLMAALVLSGRIRRDGDLYHFVADEPAKCA